MYTCSSVQMFDVNWSIVTKLLQQAVTGSLSQVHGYKCDVCSLSPWWSLEHRNIIKLFSMLKLVTDNFLSTFCHGSPVFIQCNTRTSFLIEEVIGSYLVSRSHDPHAKGYIREEEFVQCLLTHLGSTSMDANIGQLVEVLQSGVVPPGWVPYPRFLAMFESKEQQQQLAKRSFSSQSASLQASPEKPSSPRKQPRIATLDKVCQKLQLCLFAEVKHWNM